MLSFAISAVSSNSGKTILTTALLYHFRKSVRPYKIGPDFIDPQFHKFISQTNSINLDSFIMNQDEVKWIFHKYKKQINIIEGVMGFYDGEDKGCSTYSITKLLNIPTILILDGSGSYITLSAILQGMLQYKKDNTIKAVVFNNISSQTHFELIKNQINQDHKNIIVLGWIKKNLQTLQDTHLGLDLQETHKLKQLSSEILANIDLDKLQQLILPPALAPSKYPFPKITKSTKTIAVVYDSNFSFLYYDNLIFFQEIFSNVVLIDSTKDQTIPQDIDIVYISGGYVETISAYNKIKSSNNFKNSLINHSKTKPIYAECAGLLYLGKFVDDKQMSGILDVGFTLCNKKVRLGYYYNCDGIKGHAFHYTKPLDLSDGFCILSKKQNGKGQVGSWKIRKTYGTYLHTMFRTNPHLIYF